MKKEHFITQKKLIEVQINNLKIELLKLKQEYIKSNAKFEVGQKVKIITPPHKFWIANGEEGMTEHKERFAYIEGYAVDHMNNVCPKLKKAKKDGTISKHDDWCRGERSIIEKL